MTERRAPAAYVQTTDKGIEIVDGYMRLRGTLDVLHRAVVEDVKTGEQFEVKYAQWGGAIVMGSQQSALIVRA